MIRKSCTIIFLVCLMIFSGSSNMASKNQPRGFDRERLKELNSVPRFNYDRTFEPKVNFATVLLTKIVSFIAWIFNTFLGYLILAALLVLLIRVIAGNVSVFYKSQRKFDGIPVEVINHEEELKKNYDDLIDSALVSNDLRLAIRYMFLKTMMELSQKEIIQWNKEKTNREYLIELPSGYRKDFKSLSSVFEYVWYGNYPATPELFNFTKLKMQSMLNRTWSE